jgi:hypothetical protein
MNTSSQQIGIDKMKVKWTQMNEIFNYNLSRFQLFLDENQSLINYSDKESLQTC